jgi:prephenate dehydratase
MSNHRIAFQGVLGAYSDLACRAAYPGSETLPCPSFEAAMAALRDGQCDLAMLPCENSLAGRVPDIHRMLPDSGLFVVGEHFQRVEHCLLAPKGASLATLKRAHSHPVALGQVLRLLKDMSLTPVIEADTAGAAALIAERGGVEDAAIASELAAEIYGLEVLKRNVEDEAHNTTRFYVMSRDRAAQCGDHLRVSGAVHPCGALQGAWWLCHQWHQHDQAGKLYGGRTLRRDAIPVRCGWPPGPAGAPPRF